MNHIFRLFSCILLAATIACGSNKATTRIGSEEIQDTSAVIMRVEQGSAQVTAINKEGTTVNVTLFADDHLVMLDEDMTDSQGQLWKLVVVDNNSESGAEPYYIKANDLAAIAMNIISEDDDADWSVMRAARMTYCYRYVKQYLLKVGLVKVYLPGVSAYMAADILPKHGFKKVSRKPSQAIVHDVCVYKGGPSGHGHIEIKTSKGWYYGYGYKKNPIQNRIFIGCFHK